MRSSSVGLSSLSSPPNPPSWSPRVRAFQSSPIQLNLSHFPPPKASPETTHGGRVKALCLLTHAGASLSLVFSLSL